MERKLTIMNVLLGTLISLTVVLCAVQLLTIKQYRESHQELFSLVKNHFGHVEFEDLKKEGRRLAFANHFAKQYLIEMENGRYVMDKLLELGPEGIRAYLALNERKIVNAIGYFTNQSELYGHQLLAKEYLPKKISEEDRKHLSERLNRLLN